ncbi:MAG: cupredoxin domain-containing protein [Bacteroidota bacterium]
MKTQWVVLMVLLLFGAAVNANAQCGMMGSGGSGHKHGDANTATPDEHSKHTATTASKAYAFINDDGIQEATIVIKDGYHPSTLVVKKGIPLRLNFDLQEEKCTGTVVFKDFDIKNELNPSEVTAVEFIPDKSGSFAFSCPMEMIQGTLVVKE